MCFAPSGVANIHNVFFRHSSPSVPFWTENNICGSLSGILYCSSTAQRPRAQTLAAQASPHNQRHVKCLQQSAFIITKRQPALITMLRASTGWGRSTRTATQILGFVISRPSLLSPVPSARNSVLGALQYVPLQCASLHMNLMTSRTSSVAAAASLGASPHGGQSCRSPSVGQSRKRRPSVDWPDLLFPRGMRSSYHATSRRFLRAAASRRRWLHSVTIRYTSGMLFCGRNICLGFVLRASSSRARESSAAPRCIQFPTLASLHVR